MKATDYFLARWIEPDRAWIKQEWIKQEWIERVIHFQESEAIENDGRIRKWGKIAEANNRYLHVVLLKDGETVHNAFFDRRFKPDKEG
jgi:hypothetical protein